MIQGTKYLEMTYKRPTPKMRPKPIFCLLGSCNDLTTGIGMQIMTISEMMLNDAVEK